MTIRGELTIPPLILNPSSAPALAVALAGGTPTLAELVLMIDDEDEVNEGMTEEVDVRVVTETLRALLLEALVDRTEVVDLAEVVEMTEEVDRATVVVITEPVTTKWKKSCSIQSVSSRQNIIHEPETHWYSSQSSPEQAR